MMSAIPTRWLSPIKINLFLHINGTIDSVSHRGYHALQTYMQRLDYGDELTFECNHECSHKPSIQAPGITVQWQEGEADTALKPANMHDDLIYRAAVLLQTTAIALGLPPQGAGITLIKNTPVGGGLGGGSSAAATTLMALNQLWGVHLSLAALTKLAIQLGADVPFFLHNTNAWAEGIGDQITPYPSPVSDKWFVIIVPDTYALTAQGYAHPKLNRHEARRAPESTMTQWQTNAYNAFEAPLLADNPTLLACHEALWRNTGFSRLTGSGACLFSLIQSKERAEQVAAKLMRETPEIQRIIIAKACADQTAFNKAR